MSFNVGSDTTLTLVSPLGLVSSTSLTGFDARQKTTPWAVEGIDGTNRYREVPVGWDLSFDYDRQDAVLDTYFAAVEAAQYLGVSPPPVIIVETTTNVDGTIAIFRYSGVTLKFDTIGARRGAGKVEMKVSGTAGRRIQVA